VSVPVGEGCDLFREFFTVVHGVEPFAWQMALAERVIEGGAWPTSLEVPTGLGKTAALDVAVVALALQANLDPAERTAPTRTFVVVNRRLIVDQAFERAKRIAEALNNPRADVTRQVAEALCRIGGGRQPLEVVRMRGGVTWSWRWLASPAQPAIVAATVDQFGSRLLFRGYGVGERQRPIDAALCGCDALVLVDEAHLARPLI
jgi:CRISPR-associated endonuclease/helicase Cas3